MADDFVPCVPECLPSCRDLGCWAESQLDLSPHPQAPADAPLVRHLTRELAREAAGHVGHCRDRDCRHFAHRRWR